MRREDVVAELERPYGEAEFWQYHEAISPGPFFQLKPQPAALPTAAAARWPEPFADDGLDNDSDGETQ